MNSLPEINHLISPKDIECAKRVLKLERDALDSLISTIGDEFAKTIAVLLNVTGRVIVSGMGKSGHVARKIAATMASTGTPAQYVHPGEASHGDLGMITERDAVIALSNSGETAELADLVAYTRRFSIPLIGMTGGKESSLAQESDLTLLLPDAPEACAIGMAPTTSTTMMLALGDALAIALFERREMTAEQFRTFHPGGKLGARLKKVRDLMHKDDAIPLCPRQTKMSDALVVMTQKSLGCIGITENEKLIGVITDGDLRRKMSPDLLNQTVDDILSPNPKTIAPNVLVAEAMNIMNEKSITGLFVVDDSNKPVGILHMHDLLRAGVS